MKLWKRYSLDDIQRSGSGRIYSLKEIILSRLSSFVSPVSRNRISNLSVSSWYAIVSINDRTSLTRSPG